MDTKIFKISKLDEKSLAEIKESADVLRAGGLVVFPTETVYGLGADATREECVRKIYEAKGRPQDNPLIIHIADPRDASKYTFTSDIYFKLAERFMPGPLTVIMPSRDNIPKDTRGGLDTVAVRCPSNEIARALIKALDRPIAAPSANLSGTPSPTKAEHVIADMSGRVDVIIDGGECDFGLESTIVRIEDDGGLTLLRPGKITVEDLLTVAFEVRIADAVTDKLKDGEVALSPGMKYRHYAPSAELVLIDAEDNEFIEYINNLNEENIAVITYSELLAIFEDLNKELTLFDFGHKSDEFEQAQRLFAILRETDKLTLTRIYAPLPKKEGIGLALYNRMIRAAAHKIIRMRR